MTNLPSSCMFPVWSVTVRLAEQACSLTSLTTSSPHPSHSDNKVNPVARFAAAFKQADLIPFSLGVAIVCNSRGAPKKSLGLPNGWSSLDKDPAQVSERHNGLGLLTGQRGGLLVLDVDDVDGWKAYLEWRRIPEPAVPKVVTQSGGWHYYFRYMDSYKPLVSTSKCLVDENGEILDVDVRTDGGMIVAPPTRVRYPDGTMKGYSLANVPFGEWPLGPLKNSEAPEMHHVLLADLVDGQRRQTKVLKPRLIGGRESSSVPRTNSGRFRMKVPEVLQRFIEREYKIAPRKLYGLDYDRVTGSLVVPTNCTDCAFFADGHSSNHNYLTLFAREGKWFMSRKCFSTKRDVCKARTAPVPLPGDVAAELCADVGSALGESFGADFKPMVGMVSNDPARNSLNDSDYVVIKDQPLSLLQFISRSCGILPAKLGEILFHEESKCYIMRTREKGCMYLETNTKGLFGAEHEDSSQYLRINPVVGAKHLELSRWCSHDDCLGAKKAFGAWELSPQIVDDILRAVEGALGRPLNLTEDIIYRACADAKNKVNTFFEGNDSMEITKRDDYTLRGHLTTGLLGKPCNCGGSFEAVAEPKENGMFIRCTGCAVRIPARGIIPLTETESPNFAQYSKIVNIHIHGNLMNCFNTFNISGSPEESLVDGDEFLMDNLMIIPNNPELNRLLLDSLSALHDPIAKFFAACYPASYAHHQGDWYRFINHRWQHWDKQLVKGALCSVEFLAYYKRAQVVYLDSSVRGKKWKVTQIEKIRNNLRSKDLQDKVLDQSVKYFLDIGTQLFKTKDYNRNLLGFEDGVLELLTGKFRDGVPEDFIVNSVGYTYASVRNVPKESIDFLRTFLRQIFPRQAVEKYTLRFLASTVGGPGKEQRFHVALGNGGNGKSALIDLQVATLGDYAIKARSAVLYAKEKDANGATPALERMAGKRFVYMSEVPENEVLNSEVIKQLTGDATISVRELYKSGKEIPVTFRIFLACNAIPKWDATDGGMARRLTVVPFESKFSVDITEPDTVRNQYPEDPDFIDTLKQYRQAMMSILLEELKDYIRSGLGPAPMEIQNATVESRAEHDIYHRFKLECLVANATAKPIPVAVMEETFQRWRKRENIACLDGPIKRKQKLEKALYTASLDHNGRKGGYVDYSFIE